MRRHPAVHRRRARALGGVSIALLAGIVLLSAGRTLGHGSGAVIEVEPETVTAGGTVNLVGENLEPNEERILLLIGADVRLELGTVMTDADGMFSIEITIPAHLPSAVYEFQAIGDETLTATLNVVGGPGSSAGIPPATSDPAPRDRSPLELVIWLVVAAISLGVGALVVVRAERWGGRAFGNQPER